VSFDKTKHLTETSIKKRHLERQKLQELEQRREDQKKKQKEAEERQKEEERKLKELEEIEKEKKRNEKIRRKEDKQREREARKHKKKQQKLQAEEQKRLQEKIRFEERRLLLSQRNLQSIRLIVELLSRVKVAKIHEQEEKEAERIHLLQLEERRRQQETELRRVEEEKQRTLILFRKERELREKLVNSFLSRNVCSASQMKEESQLPLCYPLTPSENLPQDYLANSFTSTSTQTSEYVSLRQHLHYANSNLHVVNGVCLETTAPQECKQANDINPAKPLYSLTSILGNNIQHNHSASNDSTLRLKEVETHQSKGELYAHNRSDITSKRSHSQDKEHKPKSKPKRDLSREEDDHKKAKKFHKKHSSRDCSPHTRSSSCERSRQRSRELKSRPGVRQKKHHRRSYSRDRDSWSS
ncbi:uncharacterized protein ACMZJ9_021298, partial [Mantella aurantiaca]